MDIQLNGPTIIRTPTPQEVSDYLYGRGWHKAGEMWSNHSHTTFQEFEWAEALAYENFMHLFHMKSSDASSGVQDTAKVNVSSSQFEGVNGVTVKKY